MTAACKRRGEGGGKGREKGREGEEGGKGEDEVGSQRGRHVAPLSLLFFPLLSLPLFSLLFSSL
jgi:hypothetical protein